MMIVIHLAHNVIMVNVCVLLVKTIILILRNVMIIVTLHVLNA